MVKLRSYLSVHKDGCFALVAGDQECGADLDGFYPSMLTRAGAKHFAPVLNAECSLIEHGPFQVVITLTGCSFQQADQLCWAAAGYIGEDLYKLWFRED